MTILTKPIGDAKKSDKLILPLVGEDGAIPSAPPSDSRNPDEEGHVSSIILVRRARRVSSATTLILFLIALLVTSMGIIGGIFYYRQVARVKMNRMRFYGSCQIPYDVRNVDNNDLYYLNSMFRDENQMIQSAFSQLSTEIGRTNDPFRNDIEQMEELSKSVLDNDISNSFFKEQFELGLNDDENYSKIDVPTYRDGRKGRFLHDFKFNQSGIVDYDAGRCFLMNLDRELILPPTSLRNLIEKMWNGYYDINTEVIRKNMRVVTPEMKDLSSVSPRITRECEDRNIYKLEKLVSGVYKRSADLHSHAKYAEFAGRGIVEFDIHNMEDVDAKYVHSNQ